MDKPARIGLLYSANLGSPRGLLRGIKRYAETQPHWVLLPVETEDLREVELRAARPDGLIAYLYRNSQVKIVRALGRPVVNVATVLPDLPFPRVGVDHVRTGELAANHFLERGFRTFGFVGHPHHLYSTLRQEGFKRTLAKAGHPLACFHEHPARSFRLRARLFTLNEAFQAWLRKLPKPAALFACHDVWGLQVVEACRLAALRVPEDVAVLGANNDDVLCELARPSLSSVMVPAEQIGFVAAGLLKRLLAGTKPPKRPILLPPPGLITRQSSEMLAIDDPEVAAALRFLRNHSHVPVRVKDILREVPVSRRALERRFHELLQRGLGEEIRRVHVERAKQLLATTEWAMAEVAEQAGFSSQQQLSRVFRRETGMTPGAYRRKMRNPVGIW